MYLVPKDHSMVHEPGANMNSANVQKRVFDGFDLCSEGGLSIRYGWS